MSTPPFPAYSLTNFPNGINSAGVPLLGTKTLLTSAQLLALQTTAILIAPPPTAPANSGAGSNTYIIIPKRLSLIYLFGTTAYTIANADNNFRVAYVGKTTALFAPVATGLVDQTASTMVSVGAIAAGNLALTNCQNLGLEIKLVGTTPALTLGDGTLKIILEYTVASTVAP